MVDGDHPLAARVTGAAEEAIDRRRIEIIWSRRNNARAQTVRAALHLCHHAAGRDVHHAHTERLAMYGFLHRVLAQSIDALGK